jgi:hypothetical protein
MTAPVRAMDVPNPDEIIAVVRTLQDAVDVFRLMKERLGLTNEFIDEAGGLTKGHTDKVLGRSEQKRVGYGTFALFCEMFVVEFHAKINMEAVKRMQAVWEGRERPLFPHGKPGRISKKVLAAAKPMIYSEMGKLSGPARMQCLTVEHRSRIARKAAKARWRKPRIKAAPSKSCATP